MNENKPIKSLESIDLSYCTILDKNFSGVHFVGASFRGARFENVDFSGVSFQNCDFTDSRLTDCDLRHVTAVNSSFTLTIFESCALTDMKMENCDIEAVSDYDTDLEEVNMDEQTKATMSDMDEDFGSMKGGMC
mgnify:CR=1 FL=1